MREERKNERAYGAGVHMIKVHDIHVWKLYGESYHFIQWIYTSSH